MTTSKTTTAPLKIGRSSVDYYTASTLFNKTSGFMDTFDFTCNPYRGCSFSCSYCYARYFNRDEDKISNWGKWVEVKSNIANLMQKLKPGALNGKRIYLSSATDPYQPVERTLNITRLILYYMAVNHKPRLVVQTRAPLVTRDIDMFQAIQNSGGQVQVNVTVTTDNDQYRRFFEPYCPSIPARLRAVETLVDAGIQTCVTLTPLLLLENVDNFCDTLLETGCQRFITQPFRMNNYGRDKTQFMAQTSEEAVTLMAQWLGVTAEQFPRTYQNIYRYYEKKLLTRLPNLGIGKQVFQLPF